MVSSSKNGPQVALLFIGVSLAVGAASRQLLKKTRVPYTVALLLIGVALGALDFYVELGVLGESISMWANINPDLVLFVFLPALLFEGAFSFEFHQIKRCIFQMFLLAGPGVVVSAASIGAMCKWFLPYGWSWGLAILFGSVVSSTDPVAVVSLLKELGVSKHLATIIEGESLMNDGMAIVVFQLFYRIVLGQVLTAGAIVEFLCRVFFGGIALGIAFAILTLLWLRTVFNDYIIEITLTFTAAYMAFFVANEVAGMSGVLSDMTLGIIFAIFAKTMFTGESEHNMHIFWEMVTYIANTLIFVLSGVVIAESCLEQANYIEGSDWGYLILIYLIVQISRLIVVGVLFPGLALSGYGLNWREASVLVWSGLRGAVTLALALIVSHEEDYSKISKVTQARVIFFAGGVVLLTLILNGTTTQFLVSLLKMNRTSDIKKRMREFARREMYQKALTTFEEINDDEELGPADWTTVQTFLDCLKPPQKLRHRVLRWAQEHGDLHPHSSSEAAEEASVRRRRSRDLGDEKERKRSSGGKVAELSRSALSEMHMQDTRLRLLNGVQASCWSMLEEGRINQTAAMLLMQAVAESIDFSTKHKKLMLWKALKPHIKIPTYLRKSHHQLQGVLPARILNLITVDRIELAASMAAAFLRANRHARRQLRSFLGYSTIADVVIMESEQEDVPVKNFLEDVRLNFPEVLTIIRTKQVTFAILSELSGYVRNLENSGLLDEKETRHLQDSVETDMQRLHRHPPYGEMLPAGKVLQRQPLIGALPMDVRQLLCSPMKEMSKHSADVIFQQGDQPDGVWLIASGIVKVTSPELEAGHALHPLFAHGTCIGLYECLSNLPRIATATADSSLHAFFIDKQKIQKALHSNTGVADFFWKESSMELARILLPNIYGDESAHDLRRILMTSTRLLELSRGEVVEISPTEVGLLLLGAVMPPGEEEGQKGEEGSDPKLQQQQQQEGERREAAVSIKAPSVLHFVLSAFDDEGSKKKRRKDDDDDGVNETAEPLIPPPPPPEVWTRYRVTRPCKVLIIQQSQMIVGSVAASPMSHSLPTDATDTHHTGLLRWASDDGEEEEGGFSSDAAEDTISKDSELGRLLANRLEMEQKLSERAMQLSTFGSKVKMVNRHKDRKGSGPRFSGTFPPSDLVSHGSHSDVIVSQHGSTEDQFTINVDAHDQIRVEHFNEPLESNGRGGDEDSGGSERRQKGETEST